MDKSRENWVSSQTGGTDCGRGRQRVEADGAGGGCCALLSERLESGCDGVGDARGSVLFGFSSADLLWFPLPEGIFTAELIDPWQMTVTTVREDSAERQS